MGRAMRFVPDTRGDDDRVCLSPRLDRPARCRQSALWALHVCQHPWAGPLRCVEDTASGRVVWRDRAVGRLLTETAHAGDAVLFAEISRMACSTLQVLEMLEHCMMQGVSVH